MAGQALNMLALALAALVLPHCGAAAARSVLQSGGTISASVGIVGGGMAGLRAATVLEEYGVKDWVLLEARPALGGRIKAAELSGGTIVELGANWVQGAVETHLAATTSAPNTAHLTATSVAFGLLPGTVGNPLFDLVRSCGINGTFQVRGCGKAPDAFGSRNRDSDNPQRTKAGVSATVASSIGHQDKPGHQCTSAWH